MSLKARGTTIVNMVLSTARFKKKLSTTQIQSRRAMASMVTGMRRTAQLGIMLSQAFGSVLSQQAQLGIEASLLTLELFTTTSAAVAAGTFGVGAMLRAGARLAAIISMLAVINQLKQHQTQAASMTQGWVSAFRLLSF